jgi:hypothetical protein
MSQSQSGAELNFPHDEGGFRYAVANEKFGDTIVDVLSESFSREPMSAALGISAHDYRPLVSRFMPECTTNGLSLIAMPVDHPDTLAGVFICRDFKSPFPEGVPEEFPWLHPIAEALVTVDEAYERKRPGLILGEAVDLWMVGVPPGSQFAKRGIASNLFRLCVDLARTRGFDRCVTECTGHYSQMAARKIGFQERARLVYQDFRFEGRAVFTAIEPPHTDLILFELEFEQLTEFVAGAESDLRWLVVGIRSSGAQCNTPEEALGGMRWQKSD